MANLKFTGYEAGQQRSFAPSTNAEWVHEFNKLLFELNSKGDNISRNKLTEKLIEDGLIYNNIHPAQRETISFKTEGFTQEELRVLRSEVGHDLVKRALVRLLNEDRNHEKPQTRIEYYTDSTENQIQKNNDESVKKANLNTAKSFMAGME